MSNTVKYFQLAQEVSKKIGWLPEVIYTQWQVETAHFTSKNFKKNNNIAGQTWYPGLPQSSKGTARPKSEGGYYIKYDDPITGYVDFILSNPRYSKVKTYKTANAQFKAIAAAGWAASPNYADVLISVNNANIRNGLYKKIIKLENPYNGIVKKGARGEQVKKIQEKVGVKVDGIFGVLTENAVKEFQRKNGLAIDGIVGKETWSKLFNPSNV
ncbi:glucosaminidase domain-containing protein [Gottfriedia luciferensis]|uniref:glucosaminidase domain-containing protein n=1 Tax=Gottfriedia luciferensis TaxID=178774 RepID=UPI001F34961D|nr:glucosaminidase domain-containing protein [Gottfriedia luciferensis]